MSDSGQFYVKDYLMIRFVIISKWEITKDSLIEENKEIYSIGEAQRVD